MAAIRQERLDSFFSVRSAPKQGGACTDVRCGACGDTAAMDLGLAGTVAIVGGSSSGMGRATARTLAGEGCRVVLFARRAELLTEVAAAITAETGTEALAVPTDATNPAALDAVVDEALERFGRLDIVVNNAGGPPAGGYEQLGDDDFQRAYELTLLSALRLTRRALPGAARERPRPDREPDRLVRQGAERGPAAVQRVPPRRDRVGQDDLARGGPARHHRQLDRARLHRHRSARGAVRERGRPRGRAAARRGHDPRRPLRRPRGDRGRRGVPVLDRRGVHHRDDAARRRRPRPGSCSADGERRDRLGAAGEAVAARPRAVRPGLEPRRAQADPPPGRAGAARTGTRICSARPSTSWMRPRPRSTAPRSIRSGPTPTSAWPWPSGWASRRSASSPRTALRP